MSVLVVGQLSAIDCTCFDSVASCFSGGFPPATTQDTELFLLLFSQA